MKLLLETKEKGPRKATAPQNKGHYKGQEATEMSRTGWM